MTGQRRSAIARTLVAALLMTAAWFLKPAAAEAQARGTLQVTAQVVDTKISSDGLLAARAALQQAAVGAPAKEIGTVPTLAQVSVARSAEATAGLVATVDYSKD